VAVDGHALRLASGAGHLDAVLVCLSGAATELVDDQDASSYTALHYAAFGGHTEVCKALVAANADVARKTRNGYNAMHFAATNKHAATQQILMDAGVAQNVPNFFRERTFI